jgi:hypothetical protein
VEITETPSPTTSCKLSPAEFLLLIPASSPPPPPAPPPSQACPPPGEFRLPCDTPFQFDPLSYRVTAFTDYAYDTIRHKAKTQKCRILSRNVSSHSALIPPSQHPLLRPLAPFRPSLRFPAWTSAP